MVSKTANIKSAMRRCRLLKGLVFMPKIEYLFETSRDTRQIK